MHATTVAAPMDPNTKLGGGLERFLLTVFHAGRASPMAVSSASSAS